MFDKNRYAYVEVMMERDGFLETLEEDLLNWSRHLFKVRGTKGAVVYRGLIPVKEFQNLELLTAISPYGAGYMIVKNGELYKNYGWKEK